MIAARSAGRRAGAVVAAFAIPAVVLSAPIEETDLASSTAWTISANGGTPRSVIVPGGGFNSNQQTNSIGGCEDNGTVVYQRSINIPSSAAGKVVKVLFGAVTYGGDVFIDGTEVASFMGPMLPFEADLTGHVTAGSTHTLEVRSHSRGYYGGAAPHGCHWARLACGITKYVKMVILPPVYIKDVFVASSVIDDHFIADVWVTNTTGQEKTLSLTGALSSWNSDPWQYPSVPMANVTVPAGATVKTRIGPVGWSLGAESYWWPNIPFRENYRAKLHYLDLRLAEGQAQLDTFRRRFGFVQYGEGPYYYTINGVRVNHASDGTSEAEWGYDAYSAMAGWMEQGCTESFKRYMRLGVNTNRTHSSIPAEHMMRIADEVGFMLVPESAIRGWDQCSWDPVTHPQTVRDMVEFCRNYPSVVRYAVHNEMNWDPTGGDWIYNERLLIDAAWERDTSRPQVVESSAAMGDTPGIRVGVTTNGHAYSMRHYEDYRSYTPRETIIGMGEYAWQDWVPNHCGNGDLMRLADLGLDMRKRDWAYFAIWDIYQRWGNFLEGAGGRSGRSDGVDGWGSEEVEFLQRCLHPYVLCDDDIDQDNLCYSSNWPSSVPSTSSGSTLSRNIEVFNGGLRGSRFKVIWEARWGSATGNLAATGITNEFTVEPGFHETAPVSLTVPSTSASASPIEITQGAEVYEETRYYYNAGGQRMYLLLKSVLLDGDQYPLATAGRGQSAVLRGMPEVAIVQDKGILTFTVAGSGPHRLELVGTNGRVMRSFESNGRGQHRVGVDAIGRGFALLRIQSEAGRSVKRIVLRR